MSMWEFSAALDGYNRLHGENKIEPPTEDEFERAIKRADRVFGSETVH